MHSKPFEGILDYEAQMAAWAQSSHNRSNRVVSHEASTRHNKINQNSTTIHWASCTGQNPQTCTVLICQSWLSKAHGYVSHKRSCRNKRVKQWEMRHFIVVEKVKFCCWTNAPVRNHPLFVLETLWDSSSSRNHYQKLRTLRQAWSASGSYSTKCFPLWKPIKFYISFRYTLELPQSCLMPTWLTCNLLVATFIIYCHAHVTKLLQAHSQ